LYQLFSIQSDTLVIHAHRLLTAVSDKLSIKLPICCLSTAHPVVLFTTRFSLSAKSNISSATHAGSEFIALAKASGVPYLFSKASCHSSVKISFAIHTFESSGFVFHLICAETVFKKLQGKLEINLTAFGDIGFHITVSGASSIYSPKLAVLSATYSIKASSFFSSHSVGANLLSFISFNSCNQTPRASA
jgi:hypothetical protein